MGVVNVTPDSFSDGGEFLDAGRAVQRGLELLEEGADILDIGGESTRPGAEPLSADEERRRVVPVIEGILREAPHAVISIDTYKAETAHAALEAGAEIVNDVSAGMWDPDMLRFLASQPCGCVLMHTRGRPNDWKTQPTLAQETVVPLVLEGMQRIAEHALHAGIARPRIVLDPGFGFGKRLEENFPLLANFAELHRLGFPLLSGTSRKSFIAKAVNGDSSAKFPTSNAGTLATVVASILQGAHIVRVHEVRTAVEAAKVTDAIARGNAQGK
ncbi:MAG: dihydropteroate synthase [Acidobacteria bacterium]|nr:dihydropteroate synthase [Acidobacteriota bacterium]